MLFEIIRKEILEHLMGLRFAIACVLCFVVILCSLFVRLQDYNQVLIDYNQNVSQAKKQLKDMDSSWQVVYFGQMVHQAPNPLKIFVRGIDADNGLSLHIRGNEPVQVYGGFMTNPLEPLFPAMDMVNFVGIIMSLLAIVFGYDAICGEKQRGTLRLMLSYSIPRDKVLLGKWLGGLATLMLPFILTVFSAVIVVLIQANVSLTQVQWLKFAGVCGLALLYITAIFTMAMWISCVTPRPATSIMVLAAIWLVLILAIPNLSPYLAQNIKPAPNPMEIETTRMTTSKEIWKRQIDEVVADYNKEHGFKTDAWWNEVNWNDDEEWKRGRRRDIFGIECFGNASLERIEACQKIDEDFERAIDTQARLSRWISRISPFSCLALSATELTDTGLLEKKHFIKQIRKFQRQWSVFSFGEYTRYKQVEYDLRGTGAKLPPWPDPDYPFPIFTYTQSVEIPYGPMVLIDAGILVGFTLVFFMLSFVSFLRYDVR